MPEVNVGEIVDGYRVTELISRGLTSSILKAEDPARGRTVALKIPHAAYEGDPVFRANLAREERIGIRLNHHAVLKTFPTAGRTRPYVVSEYVEGTPLRARLWPNQPLETEEALDIARQLAETAAYFHSERVIHRDLKPENVHLLPKGGIKVLDFGLALDRPPRWMAWLGSTTVGTPDYMAPEQARGLQGDERSDVYAIGTILYEMLTGALPFPFEDPAQIMLSKLASDPVPPTHVRPELSPALEEIILRAIEHRPNRRYSSAAELAAVLADPALVRPTGRAARLHPRTMREILVRRTLRYVGLGLGTVAGLVVLVWLANRYPAGPVATLPGPAVHAPSPAP